MTQREMRLAILNKMLAEKYEKITIRERDCFQLKDGRICRLDDIGGGYNALVIEYADNLEMARKGVFGEDGDLYCMDEMSESEMFEAMIREIEE